VAELFKANKNYLDEEEDNGLFKSSTTDKVSNGPYRSISDGNSLGTGLFKASSNPLENLKINPFDTTKTERQIANAKLRIERSGFTVDEDKRNPVEKALNLPEGQNWFFDTLDILNRPQQAIFGAMDAIQKSANGTPTGRGEAFMKGLKGEQKVRGSDLLANAGVDNKYLKGGLGLTLDIAVDPLSVLPTKYLDRAVQATGSGVKKGYLAAENAAPAAVKNFRQNTVQPALQSGKDALGNIFVPKYKWNQTLTGGKDDFLKNRYIETENSIRYMGEDSLRGITDAARKSGGLDTGTDVGRLMEKDLKQFEDVKMFELPDGVRRTTSKRELDNEIIGNKQRIKGLGTAVRDANKVLDSDISSAAQNLERLDNQIRRLFDRAELRNTKQLQKKAGAGVDVSAKASTAAFDELSGSPSFNLMLQQRDTLKSNLDQMRVNRSASGQSEISEIQKLVDENKAIKESAKNPVMVQREIARPQRDYSTDPAVVKASETLVKSNDAIRQWAINNEIPVGEIEGYMRHILSAEEAALRKTKKGGPIDYTPRDMNSPDKSVLRSRELTGSVEDINERIGRKFFEPNAFFASALGQKKLIEYGNAVKFRKDVLSNPNFAAKMKPGDTVPEGAVAINTNNYKFLSDPANPSLTTEIGGEYIVTPGVKQALDRYSKLTTDQGINDFLKGYDKVQSGWKKLTLLSPGYHIRNDVGAKFNNYVGGMRPDEIARYSTSAFKDVADAMTKGKESPLYNEFRRQGLGSNSQLAMEFAKHGNDAEKAMRDIVKDQSRTGLSKAAGTLNPFRIFKTSQELGTAIDQINRMAMYKWARQSQKMTPEQAAQKVKEVQFDYSDLTPAEREIFTRFVPFYRWSRNNIPFQLSKLVKDPTKYATANKVREASQNYFGMDPNQEQDFTKNSFAVPVSGDGQGNGKMLGLNLPLSDITKVSDPMKLITDSLSPLIKTPIELGMNFDLYKGRDIQNFEGEQKKYALPDSVYGMNVPGGGRDLGGIAPLTNHALRQLGGQPVRGLMDVLGVPTEREKEEAAISPSFGIKQMLKNYNIDETNFYAKKAELRELMDLINYIEQETGNKPKTIRDIKKGL
jgi:hypothetical protein